MREFENRLQRELLRGLRPNDRLSRGSSFLEKAQGVECNVRGLEVYQEVINPINNGPAYVWPYPMLHRLSHDNLLVSSNSFYSFEEGTWNATPLVTEYLGEGSYSISGKEIWHIAESQNTWFAVNGNEVAFRVEGDDSVSLIDFPIKSGCYHKGRFVFGGFDPDKGWGDLAQVIHRS